MYIFSIFLIVKPAPDTFLGEINLRLNTLNSCIFFYVKFLVFALSFGQYSLKLLMIISVQDFYLARTCFCKHNRRVAVFII